MERQYALTVKEVVYTGNVEVLVAVVSVVGTVIIDVFVAGMMVV